MSRRIEDEIVTSVNKILNNLILKGLLPGEAANVQVKLEIPKNELFGELSTNLAMDIARRVKISPVKVAELIVNGLRSKFGQTPLFANKIKKIEIKPPGFINFFLSAKYLYNTLLEIKRSNKNYGKSNIGRGRRFQIEFVSANPTGPLTIAHGRQAAVGDGLANVLKANGYRVSKEYYINDQGTQIDLLGESVRARYLEIFKKKCFFPENGYNGQYIKTIAEQIIAKYGPKYIDSSGKKDLEFFSGYALRTILNGIKKDLKVFRVSFDKWFSQAAFSRTDKVKKTLEALRKKDYLYEKDGATWLRSMRFGDDKDRVLIKNDGNFTYITPDIAYHQDKFRRGFKKVIDIWGPDHHGYIPRLKAAIQALGYPKDILSAVIVQLVTLYDHGKALAMSTRTGEFITLRQIVEEVGVDVSRFFFLMRKKDSHFDFDLDLARKESDDNPVYYIQYAYARICSIIRFSRRGIHTRINPFLLDKPEEIRIIKVLRSYSQVVCSSARFLEPQQITVYARTLAKSFHNFYTKYRVVTEDNRLTLARLLLVDCVRIVLKNCLTLLGITAPKKM
ncbi:MAG: arginine--tRNA ligase [Candidatus Omnitrophota bacterium]|nr:arginine--tRNA ligase [Candidatus Omnitrophota bacterium]